MFHALFCGLYNHKVKGVIRLNNPINNKINIKRNRNYIKGVH